MKKGDGFRSVIEAIGIRLRVSASHRAYSRAFVMLEIVFALIIIGVAFGMLAHFYTARTTSGELPVKALDMVQEQALLELESRLTPRPYSVVGEDGLACEGELFATTISQNTLKFFVPKACEKPKSP